MKLAYVTVQGRGRTDDLLADVVRAFEDDGLRLAGTVRTQPADPSGHPCDMDLRVLPDCPGFRIRQPLGRMAKGCRLDGGVIEAIATEVEAVEATGAVHVVPGHGHSTTMERARADTYDYLMNLRTQIGALLDEGGDIMDAPKVDQSSFTYREQFEAWAGRNAQTAIGPRHRI